MSRYQEISIPFQDDEGSKSMNLSAISLLPLAHSGPWPFLSLQPHNFSHLEAVHSSRTMVSGYQITECHITDNSILHSRCHENFQFHIILLKLMHHYVSYTYMKIMKFRHLNHQRHICPILFLPNGAQQEITVFFSVTSTSSSPY